MKKILGVLAAMLLVCATAIAKPQTATTTGHRSACATTTESDIGVIFNQHATFTGSCETIEVGCITTAGDIELWMNRVALFMGSDIGVQVTDVATVDSSGIFVSIHQVANFNGPATKAIEVSDTIIVIFTALQMFDSAFSICFNQAKLAIFMDKTEVDQLLKGPRSTAFIYQPRSVMNC